MKFRGFTQEDFDVFLIDGLDERMEALKTHIRPKLESLGQSFAPALAALTNDEMFVHIAKHARRTVNPPKDTWVAFANNPRGYKMLPHFQIGLWNTHLFIWFAIIYEAPRKEEFGRRLSEQLSEIMEGIPGEYHWSLDHTKPETIKHEDLSNEELQGFFERLQKIKKAELLCGFIMDKVTVINKGSEGLLQQIEEVFNKVAPLYKIAQSND